MGVSVVGMLYEIPNFVIRFCALKVSLNETKGHAPDPWRLHSGAASHCLLRWTSLYPTTAAAMVMFSEKHGRGQVVSKKKKKKAKVLNIHEGQHSYLNLPAPEMMGN